MAIGQIATPILLATVFQLLVLLATALIRPLAPGIFVPTLLLLVPLNGFVFAADNFIYLLYPYRLDQEGLEIFIRATLTFTAKAVLFAVVAGGTYFWASPAARLAKYLTNSTGMPVRADFVFLGGAGLILAFCAGVAIYLLASAFCRLDPIQDAPG
jgi:hypothetical protein